MKISKFKQNIFYLVSILLLLLGIILIIFLNFYLYESKKKHYDIIISVNVHEKFNFLLKQLDNFRENIHCNYAVILNCNQYMYDECRKNNLPDNVFIHDTILEKKTFHGSITKGIYNNISYALNVFTFEYFIVASSRNLFKDNMDLEYLRKLQAKNIPFIEIEEDSEWWNYVNHSLLYKYFEKHYNSAHEGLVLTKVGCEKIVDFLENNIEIKEDLFSYPAQVEEFSLQTISMNMGEYFYYIGNGCCSNNMNEKINYNDPIYNIMYKTIRE